MPTSAGPNISGEENLVFGYDLSDENSYLGEPSVNLATDTPTMGGWPGAVTLVDSATKTFDFKTSSVEWGGDAAWTTFYYDVSEYIGQYITISAVFERAYEENGKFSYMMIGQTISGQTFLGYSGEADRVSKTTKTRERISWSGVIGDGGKVGIMIWMGNGSGAPSGYLTVRFSNVQVELKSHPTPYIERSPITISTNLAAWGKQPGVTVEATTMYGAKQNQNVWKINFGSYSGGDAIGTSVTAVIGYTYTFSGWVKADSNTSGYITIGRANSNPSSQKAMSITTSWQYFEVSFTLNTNTTLYHNFAGINTSYYVSDLKMELSQRSATNSLLDSTGNVDIDLSNVSFDSNAQMTFDGTNDEIIISPNSIFNTNVFTVESVFKLSTFDNNHRTIASHNASVYSHNNGWWMGTLRNGLGNNNNDFRMFFWGSSSYVVYNTTLGGNDGNHHHMVISCDGNKVFFYVDGVLEYTTTKPSGNVYLNGETVLIGRSPSGDFWSGDIPMVKYYNRNLSTTEVVNNHNNIKSKYGI